MVELSGPNDDMGLAQRINTAIELQIVIPHIADVLSKMPKVKGKAFSYCFGGHVGERKQLSTLVHYFKDKLPDGVSFYECDGQAIFDVRGPSGGITTSLTFYLITKMEL